MLPIIITTEIAHEPILECQIIASIINEFGCRVHLRKKKESKKVTEMYCMLLAEMTDLSKITLHGYPDLVVGFELGGYHDTPEMIKKYRKSMPKGTLFSTSCHSFEEVRNAKTDYAFLSPIFNSISKEGYVAGFDLKEVTDFLSTYKNKTKVIALGGVDDSNISQVYDMGFATAALLGAVWDSDDPLDEYEYILNNI